MALVAPIAFAAIAFAGATFQVQTIVFPLAVAVGDGASIVASFLVRSRGDDLAVALRRGTLGAGDNSGGGGWARILDLRRRWKPVGLPSVMVGLPGLFIGQISEWFTSDGHRSVKEIARQSQTGPATVVITGLAEDAPPPSPCWWSLLILGAFTAGQWALGDGGGVYGVAIAAIGVLATVGMTISVDAYGPIADNAGGIAQMAHLPSEVREATDALDASATPPPPWPRASPSHRRLSLHWPCSPLSPRLPGYRRSTSPVDAVVGVVYRRRCSLSLRCLTMNAVGRAAGRMIDEVRRSSERSPVFVRGNRVYDPITEPASTSPPEPRWAR